MTCFAPSNVQPGVATQDPTKHVNYALGMVLGVDDLTQEFSYLSQRDQWLARDLHGYGTVWGLAVSLGDGGPRGPEVLVSSGVAINPRGQLIRVAPAQCAAVNDWLQSHAADVVTHRAATATAGIFTVPVYLVLSYRTCLTDPVPIAGEPCRSEDDSTAPSRVADDFLLELSFDPPPQQEEDAIRFWVQWLSDHLSVVPAGPPSMTVADFVTAIRAASAAAQAANAATPPPARPFFLVEPTPDIEVSVTADQLAGYLRAAMRLWVTELRPLWRPDWMGDKHACAGDELLADPDQGNQVLLAQLTLTVGSVSLTDSTPVQVSPAAIDETARPFVLQSRLLQEWLLTQVSAIEPEAVLPELSPLAATTAKTVAAGIVSGNGTATTRAVMSNLRVASFVNVTGATHFTITFDGYVEPPANGGPQYILKATPWSAALHLTVAFVGFQPGGMILSLSKAGKSLTAADVAALDLMVEVTQLS
jgi:hypothetical protein